MKGKSFIRRWKVKKKWLWTLGFLLVIPAVLLSGCGCSAPTTVGAVNLNLTNQQSGIWVTGEGEATAVPDVATLRLGVEATQDTVEGAQAQAAEAMDGVMTALKDNDVAEKDIQTEYFRIHKITRWDRDEDEEVVIGYRVSNIVTAKIRDVEEAGSIIDAVVEAGGDLIRVDDISFSVDDPSAYYREAREEAVADAEAKAEQLAKAAGVRLGEPTYVSESTYVTPPIFPRAAMEAIPAPAPAVETPISPGEMEIRATVQVVYSILD